MIRIITDSTSSIPSAIRKKLGIEVVSLHVNRGDAEYEESEMDLDSFYSEIDSMVDDIPTSSQPSPSKLQRVFEEAAESGDETVGLFLSSRMSGTFENAVRVARGVRERYPEFKCSVLDSLTNCLELGWPVMAAAKARDAGANLRECVEEARHSLESSRFLFTPESLRFLEKGGRIGKAAALLGNLMNVSPIITVKDGFASTYAKVRTQKRALAKIVDVFKQDVEENGLKNVAVHYIGSRKAAEEWAGSIESSVGRDVLIVPASPVIGLHVGPALGLAYECENPLPNKFAGARPEIVTV